MKAKLRNPFIVAFLLMIAVAAVFFLFPIEIFNGEVTYTDGRETITVPQQRLSLSYFVGVGLQDGKSLNDIASMRLDGKSYLLATLLIVGFPALIGYRVWIGNQNKDKA